MSAGVVRARVLLLLLLPVAARAEDPLPRIFHTPAERAAIVILRGQIARNQVTSGQPVRNAAVAPVAADNAESTTPARAAVPTSLRLDGISVNERGQFLAWISGQRYLSGARLGARRLEISRQGVLLMSADGRQQAVRVGESFDVAGQGARATR